MCGHGVRRVQHYGGLRHLCVFFCGLQSINMQFKVLVYPFDDIHVLFIASGFKSLKMNHVKICPRVARTDRTHNGMRSGGMQKRMFLFCCFLEYLLS